MDAVKEVIKLASENTELRSKLETEPVCTTNTEPYSSKSEPTKPEENEPEPKFTLKEVKARFFELCKQFPDKKQSEYLSILDSEGYKNSVGNKIGPSNISRWLGKMGGGKSGKKAV